MATARYVEITARLKAKRATLDAPLRLPDEHALAAEHGVARDTVRRALRELEREGAVIRRPRRGTFLQPARRVVHDLKHRAIGFIPPPWAEAISHWYTSRVFDGISRWAYEHCCHVNVLPTGPSPLSHPEWSDHVRSLDLAGLIWVHPQAPLTGLAERLARQVPTVVVGRPTSSSDIGHVMPDYDQAATLIDEHLAGLGHKTYAVVAYDAFGGYSQRVLEAIRRAHDRRNMYFDQRNNLVDLRVFKHDKKAEILLDAFEPDREHLQAYVVTDSQVLFHLMRSERFRELVGTQRSVVTVDYGHHALAACSPGCALTHVNYNWPDVGWRAAAVLAQRITGEPAPDTVMLPVSFEPGESCCPFDPHQIPRHKWKRLKDAYGWSLAAASSASAPAPAAPETPGAENDAAGHGADAGAPTTAR